MKQNLMHPSQSVSWTWPQQPYPWSVMKCRSHVVQHPQHHTDCRISLVPRLSCGLVITLPCLRWSVTLKGKHCISHVLQYFAGIDKWVDNCCKQRAEYLHYSLIIVHMVIGRHLSHRSRLKVLKPQKSWGNWTCTNSTTILMTASCGK